MQRFRRGLTGGFGQRMAKMRNICPQYAADKRMEKPGIFRGLSEGNPSENSELYEMPKRRK